MADTNTIDATVDMVVRLMSAYMTFRVGGGSRPQDETLQRGEQVMNIVRTGVSQYGTGDEKTTLANFEREPQHYGADMVRMLTNIAIRTPVFMQELQSLVKQFQADRL